MLKAWVINKFYLPTRGGLCPDWKLGAPGQNTASETDGGQFDWNTEVVFLLGLAPGMNSPPQVGAD